MSSYAKDLQEEEIIDQAIREDFPMWTMKDGKEIFIKDMEDSHLINAIRMIERDGQRSTTLDYEASHRGLILSSVIKCCSKCNTVDIMKDHVCDFAHMANKEYHMQ